MTILNVILFFLNVKFLKLVNTRIKNRNYSIPKYFFKASLITHDLGRSNSFAFLSNSSTYSSSTSKLNLTFAIPSILNLLINILYVIIYYLKVNIFKYNIIESIKYYYFLILNWQGDFKLAGENSYFWVCSPPFSPYEPGKRKGKRRNDIMSEANSNYYRECF